MDQGNTVTYRRFDYRGRHELRNKSFYFPPQRMGRLRPVPMLSQLFLLSLYCSSL